MMVGISAQYAFCAVKLFKQQDACHLVGPGHGREAYACGA